MKGSGGKLGTAVVAGLAALFGCDDPTIVQEPDLPPVVFEAEPRPVYATIRQHWSDPPEPAGGVFTVDQHHILRDGQPYPVRGVVYVPGYPGHLPWELEVAPALPEKVRNSIARDVQLMAELGVNTVRLWGAPQHTYDALAGIGTLNLIQTLWLDSDADDLHAPAFKEQTKAYFRSVIDRIHRSFPGGSPPVVAYLVGNEISPRTIQLTNQANPGLDRYDGTHISAGPGLSATQVFLAEMADYVKRYEDETYGVTHLVSYPNMLYTADLIEAPFLDFRSYNVYPYDIRLVRPGTAAGTNSGTVLQGWVEELKARYPDVPLLITETGLSVSPDAPRQGPPNYGYGGNTEAEQAAGIRQSIRDVETTRSPSAGVIVHELLDAWWKFDLADSYSQDPADVEEWFGLVRLTGS